MQENQYQNMDDIDIEELVQSSLDDGEKLSGIMELAHRSMQRGDLAYYRQYLQAAIDQYDSDEAKTELSNLSFNQADKQKQKNETLLARLDEIQKLPLIEQTRLSHEGNPFAMIVVCRRKILNNDLQGAKKILDKLCKKEYNDFEISAEMMGELCFSLAKAYEGKNNMVNASEYYKLAAEYNHLEAIRILGDRDMPGIEDGIYYRERAAQIGNVRDKIRFLLERIEANAYGQEEKQSILSKWDIDKDILDILSQQDITPQICYELSVDLLNYNYLDAACQVLEYLIDLQGQDPLYHALTMFLYHIIYWESADHVLKWATIIEKDHDKLLIQALEAILNYTLRMRRTNGNQMMQVKLFKLSTEAADGSIYIGASEIDQLNGLNGEGQEKAYCGLQLVDLMPDAIEATYRNIKPRFVFSVQFSEGQVIERTACVNPDGESFDIDMAEKILYRDFRFVKDPDIYIMRSENGIDFIRCEITKKRESINDDQTNKVDAVVYIGSLQDDVKDGQGTQWEYENQPAEAFTPDKIDQTIKELPHKWKYTGQFTNGTRTGIGELTCADGRRWTGMFLGGQAHGEEIRFCNADKSIQLTGTYKNGSLNGEAIRVQIKARNKDGTVDGWAYQGEFEKSDPIGFGTYIAFKALPEDQAEPEYIRNHIQDIPFEVKCIGTFDKNYKLSGEGEEIDKSGKRWKGSFQKGGLNGHGIWTNIQGSYCEGEWKDNKRISAFTYFIDKRADGKITGRLEIGEYKGSNLQSNGVLLYFKETLEDQLTHPETFGANYMSLPYTWMYQGEFSDGKPQGKGKLTWPNGIVEEGHYVFPDYEPTPIPADADPVEAVELIKKNNLRFIPYRDMFIMRLPDEKYLLRKITARKVSEQENGKGKNLVDAILYIGSLHDDMRDGEGTQYEYTDQPAEAFAPGAATSKTLKELPFAWKYTGQFTNDNATGVGKLTASDGRHWEGSFENRVLQGEARFWNTDRSIQIIGIYKEGMLNGEGTRVTINKQNNDGTVGGWAYRGQFEKDESKGSGIKISFEALPKEQALPEYIRDHIWDSLFQKQIHDNIRNFIEIGEFGEGFQLSGNGEVRRSIIVRKGEYQNGRLNGHGIFSLEKRHCPYIEGEWKEGKLIKGFSYTDHEKNDWLRIGQFEDHKLLSGGTLLSLRKELEDQLSHPETLGEDYMSLPYTWMYQGEFEDVYPSGKGTITYADHSSATGTFGYYKGECFELVDGMDLKRIQSLIDNQGLRFLNARGNYTMNIEGKGLLLRVGQQEKKGTRIIASGSLYTGDMNGDSPCGMGMEYFFRNMPSEKLLPDHVEIVLQEFAEKEREKAVYDLKFEGQYDLIPIHGIIADRYGHAFCGLFQNGLPYQNTESPGVHPLSAQTASLFFTASLRYMDDAGSFMMLEKTEGLWYIVHYPRKEAPGKVQVYYGEVQDDKPEGNGKLYYFENWPEDVFAPVQLKETLRSIQCDALYEGGFHQGLRSGEGKLQSKEKLIYNGMWQNDHIVKRVGLFAQRKWRELL